MCSLTCLHCGKKNMQCLLDSGLQPEKVDVYILHCNECGEEENKPVPIHSSGAQIAPGVELWESTICPFCGKPSNGHKTNFIPSEYQLLLFETSDDSGVELTLEDDEPQRSYGQCSSCGAELAPYDGGGGVYCPEGCLQF